MFSTETHSLFSRLSGKDIIHGQRNTRHADRIRPLIRQCRNTLTDLVDPRLTYRSMKVDHVTHNTVVLEDGTVLNSEKLALVFSSCPTVIFFAATIGVNIGYAVDDLSAQGEYRRAYVLDTLGSEAIELVVDEFQKRMHKRYRPEGTVTLRFSPGYCDWPLEEQRMLFDIIDTKRIDLSLLDSCIMHPRKSISGVFGIHSPAMSASKHPVNPCRTCTIKNCPERRISN